jgi:ABC-type Fe3+/spermidine/putrescine transport system ATPase subunit
VATFVGRASILPGHWLASRGAARLEAGPVWPAAASGDLAEGMAVDVVVRPESLKLSDAPAPEAIPGEIAGRRYAGRVALYDVALDGGGAVEVLASPDAARVGQRVFVGPESGGPVPKAFVREAG